MACNLLSAGNLRLSDYMENFFFIFMLNRYPDVSSSVVGIANIFSITKSSGTSIYFLCLIILLIYFVFYRLKNRRAA